MELQQQPGVLGHPPSEQRITQSLFLGEKFVDQYYKSFTKSVGKFYTPESRIIWNGNGFSGEQFVQLLPELQRTFTDFNVTAFDAQPLGEKQTMVSVSGVVRMGEKAQFAQNFVIKKNGTMTYIVSDCFRLV